MTHRYRKILLLIAFLVLIAIPAMAVVPPGRIMVFSAPTGALACIDNNDCDATGAAFTVEGNAWHRVVVTESGYQPWTENVYVTSDQTSTVNAYLDLDRDATAVQVYVTPGGGMVCLDNSDCRANVGTNASTGSTRFTGVSAGYHTISVESPAGYGDTTKLVQVTLGKITIVNIALIPDVVTAIPTSAVFRPTGTVRVYVNRTGSTICLDSFDCYVNVGGLPGPGTGTTIFNEVTADEMHTIIVTADGFKPVSAQISVAQDLITTVDVSLQPLTGQTTVTTPTPPSETTIPAITTPLKPVPTRSSLDIIPVIVALALCGTAVLFRKNNR